LLRLLSEREMPRRPDILCAGTCGRLIWRGRGCLPEGQAMCRACRRTSVVECKPRATTVLSVTKTCSGCGREFVAVRPNGRTSFRVTCSDACVRIVQKRQGEIRTCADCGSACRSFMARPRCKSCSAAYAHARNRRKCAQRRGASPLGPALTITQLGDRDRWICHLCRRRVGRSFKAPHPRSATFDHLVPISDGGDDSAANLRLAHWGCNSSRGAGGTVQLMLVG
jgi:hypothetical protein